ncbi:MAG: sulfatase-like hydrolase/transferase [Verrucomicrobiota bacterium]
MKTASFAFILLAFAGLGWAEDRPNIMLLMADDQGYGDTGFAGHPFVKTPHLDAMAEEGVVFDRFYAAAPVCSPTRAAVMTGRHPFRVNVPNHGHYLRPDETTIAEALRDAGYVTGHFGKWHIGSVQPDSPTSPGGAGFEEWYSALNFFDVDPFLSRNGVIENPKGQGTVISMDATLDFVEKHYDDDRPFFTVTWFPSPHGPFEEVPEGFPEAESIYTGENGEAYYREITLIDQQLGRLRDRLRILGIADNTIVWYTSDNGGLQEASSGGRKKKGSIYEGGLRVPSILEWPGHLESRKINVPANSCDIYPTLVSIAGAEVENQLALDGIDLSGVIEGQQSERPSMGFWHGHTAGQSTRSDDIMKALMTAQQAGDPTPFPERILKNVEEFSSFTHGDYPGHAAWNDWPWKLHRIQDPKSGEVTVELYDLQQDPMEENNLASEDPDLASKMLELLEGWQASVYDSWEGKDYLNATP